MNRYTQEGYLWPVNSTLIIDNQYVHQTPYWTDKCNNYNPKKMKTEIYKIYITANYGITCTCFMR